MKLFGFLFPSFRKGTSVIVASPTCARGEMAELLFEFLDPSNKYRRNLYGAIKRNAKGHIVSLMKYKDPEGDSYIYYGVLIKEVLYAIEEDRLTRA